VKCPFCKGTGNDPGMWLIRFELDCGHVEVLAIKLAIMPMIWCTKCAQYRRWTVAKRIREVREYEKV